MAQFGQRTGHSFKITRRQVVECQTLLIEVASRKLALDSRLSLQQPVHRRIQSILAGVPDATILGQGGGVPGPRRRQFAGRSRIRVATRATIKSLSRQGREARREANPKLSTRLQISPPFYVKNPSPRRLGRLQ